MSVLLGGLALAEGGVVRKLVWSVVLAAGIVIVLTPLALCVFLVFMLLPDLGATPHKTVPASPPTAPSR